MKIQSIFDKYNPIEFDEIEKKIDLSNSEKELIFVKECQIPNLMADSNQPFNKNKCFYDLPSDNSIEENISENNSTTKNEQKIKPLDIDEVFSEEEIKLTNKISEIIKKGEYKEYIPPKTQKLTINYTLADKFSQEKNNKWYIIDDKQPKGPFNDFNLYKKITEIFKDCYNEGKQVPHYLIKEEKNQLYLTMEQCLEKLNKEFDKKIKQNKHNLIYLNNNNDINLRIKDINVEDFFKKK